MTSSPGQLLADSLRPSTRSFVHSAPAGPGSASVLNVGLSFGLLLAQGIAHSLPDVEVAHHDAEVGQLTAEWNASGDDR